MKEHTLIFVTLLMIFCNTTQQIHGMSGEASAYDDEEINILPPRRDTAAKRAAAKRAAAAKYARRVYECEYGNLERPLEPTSNQRQQPTAGQPTRD